MISILQREIFPLQNGCRFRSGLSNGIFIRYKSRMATAGEMAKIFSDALGLSEVHVSTRYRALREAGLVAKAARGRYTPDRTPLEGARLLIALMGAQAIAEVEAVTRIISQLKCADYEGPKSLRHLYELRSFEQVLKLLLVDCSLMRSGQRPVMGTTGALLAVDVRHRGLTARIQNGKVHALYAIRTDGEGVLPLPSRTHEEALGQVMASRSRPGGMQVETRVEGAELAAMALAILPVLDESTG